MDETKWGYSGDGMIYRAQGFDGARISPPALPIRPLFQVEGEAPHERVLMIDGRPHVYELEKTNGNYVLVLKARQEEDKGSTATPANPSIPPQADRDALREAIRKFADSQGPTFLELYQTGLNTASKPRQSQLREQPSGQNLGQVQQPAQKETLAHAAAPQAEELCQQEQLEAAQHLVQVLQYVLGRS